MVFRIGLISMAGGSRRYSVKSRRVYLKVDGGRQAARGRSDKLQPQAASYEQEPDASDADPLLLVACG